MMKFLSKQLIQIKIYAFLVILFICSGCSNIISNNLEPAELGLLNNFDKQLVKGGDFWITTYQKITDRNKPFVFYIEGDGRAFMGRYRISNNPTPRNRMFLKLATMDNRPNVIYVARPCQYTDMRLNPTCNPAYWTSKRMSAETVDSLNEVINKVNGGLKFSLVGFSGGGGMAVLIAAQNSLVKDILTINGNLDHRAFTTHHNSLPMVNSLNPIEFAALISHIPQLHLSGGRDETVPPFIIDQYLEESASSCVHHMIFENNTHSTGWVDIYDYILSLPIKCDKR